MAAAQLQCDEAQYAEALRSASRAQKFFESKGDSAQLARVLRIMVEVHRWDPEKDQCKPEEATRIAAEHLKRFRDGGQQQAYAIMCLARASCTAARGGASNQGEKAMGWTTEALAIAQDLRDVPLEAEVRLVLCGLLLERREISEGLASAECALAIFRELEDSRGEALALVELARLLAVKDLDKALRRMQQAVGLFRKAGLEMRAAQGLRSIAQWQLLADSPERALPPAREALSIVRAVPGTTRLQVATLGVVAKAFVASGRPKDALWVLTNALQAFRGAFDRRGEAHALGLLASTYNSAGDPGMAVDMAQQGLVILQELGEKQHTVALLLDAAEVHMGEGQWDEASAEIKRARTVARREELERQEFEAQLAMARLCFRQGDLTRMHEEADRAQAIAQRDNHAAGEGTSLMLLAAAYQQVGALEEAMKAAKLAAALFRDAQEPGRHSEALQQMATACMGLRRFEEALALGSSALEVARGAHEMKQELASLSVVAYIRMAEGNLAETEKVGNEGCALSRQAHNVFEEVGFLLLLAHAHVAQCSPDGSSTHLAKKARKYAGDALLAAGERGPKSLRAPAAYWLARALRASGSPEVLERAKEARALYEACGDEPGQVQAMALCADALLAAKDRAGAQKTAEEALAIARACSDVEGEEMVQEVLGRMQQRQAPQTEILPTVDAAPADGAAAVPSASVTAVVASKGLDPAAVTKTLTSLVIETLATDDVVEPDSPLMGMGMDSLASLAFANSVQKEYGMNMAPTLIFEYPDIRALTGHIIERSEE